MSQKSLLFAVLSVLVTAFTVAGCGNQPKKETVSVIDEQHFNELASAPTDGQGNAAAGVEVMNQPPALTQVVQAPIPTMPPEVIAQTPAPAIPSRPPRGCGDSQSAC